MEMTFSIALPWTFSLQAANAEAFESAMVQSIMRISPPLGIFSGFGYTEIILFGVIALMLFGSRLPEVARNFGRTYKQLRGKVDEFQREFRDWDKDDTPSYSQPRFSPDDEEERMQTSAPKFLPPPPDDDDDSSGPSAPKFNASQIDDDWPIYGGP